MNHSVTSKEEILSVCRDIVQTEGIQAVNARRVAGQLGIALGSLYNYFSSKEALVMACVASVWQEILPLEKMRHLSLYDTMDLIVQDLDAGQKAYPSFFASHAMVFGKKEGAKGAMAHMEAGLQKVLLDAIVNDAGIRSGIDSVRYAAHLLDVINGMVLRNHFDSDMVLDIVNAYAYGGNYGRNK
ncbi:MAG: TetR/AcrR family transcriptional regulator [Lactimicrobium sp.]|jgi:AcrR family transcriptional regulator|uniref:TetR/AcrR family transcriptional regulator n=1 Tax=Lactimicrobium sp. TaxID=2563780 RepID=UPI002F360C93